MLEFHAEIGRGSLCAEELETCRLMTHELLGKEVIPALHEIKLQPYEEAGTSSVSHR